MSQTRLHRSGRLLLALATRPSLSTAEAAALLGVSRPTALRCLAALVDADLGVTVTGEGTDRRYRQAGADKFAVTFGQRLALLFGQQMMGFLEGTMLEEWLGELASNLDPALLPGAGADAAKQNGSPTPSARRWAPLKRGATGRGGATWLQSCKGSTRRVG